MSTVDKALLVGGLAAGAVALYEVLQIGKGIGQTLGGIRAPGLPSLPSLLPPPQSSTTGVTGPNNIGFNPNASPSQNQYVGTAGALGTGGPSFAPLVSQFVGGKNPYQKKVPQFHIQNPEPPSRTRQRFDNMSRSLTVAPGTPESAPPPKSIRKHHRLAYAKLKAGRIR